MTASIAMRAARNISMQHYEEVRAKVKHLLRPAFTTTGGAGHELKKILSSLGFQPDKGCKCHQHASEMDRRGIGWCEQNLTTIIGWLESEAQRRNFGWIFSKMAARAMIQLAITNAKANLAKPSQSG